MHHEHTCSSLYCYAFSVQHFLLDHPCKLGFHSVMRIAFYESARSKYVQFAVLLVTILENSLFLWCERNRYFGRTFPFAIFEKFMTFALCWGPCSCLHHTKPPIPFLFLLLFLQTPYHRPRECQRGYERRVQTVSSPGWRVMRAAPASAVSSTSANACRWRESPG